MKKEIIEKNIKIKVEELNEKVEDKNEFKDNIDKLFNKIWKNRKNIIIVKKKDDKKDGKKDEKKEDTKKTRRVLYTDFIHGFYRK